MPEEQAPEGFVLEGSVPTPQQPQKQQQPDQENAEDKMRVQEVQKVRRGADKVPVVQL
jgi:hypothetical protein